MKTKTWLNIIFAVSMVALLFAAGCTPKETPAGGDNSGPSGDKGDDFVPTGEKVSGDMFGSKEGLAQKSFASEKEFISFVKQNMNAGYYGGYYGRGVVSGLAMEESATTSAPTAKSIAPAADSSAGRDYSKTNVQVESVDEADIIKTDGEYIYTKSGDTVYIIKAYPGEDAEVTSKIHIDGGSIDGLFIKGDKLAVFGNYYNMTQATRKIQRL